ncbi:MAG: hypothetical protein ACTSPI_05150 [Candidatus Heimdallarchaeaceae archaeon]
MTKDYKKLNRSESVKDLPNFSFVLQFLESKDYLKRRIGYALCIPKFSNLSGEMQRLVRKKWLGEPSKNQMSDLFIALCDKVFAAE